MSTAPAPSSSLSQKAMSGDLSKLTDDERKEYYDSVCESVGLNPLTMPFAYIVLNGKLTLYATKNCSEQLRANNGVSIEKVEKDTTDGLYVVTAYARDKRGRTDSDMGAVALGTLRGEQLANAMMKAVTKAKRRVTLSICGLGWPDESEVESIPGARRVTVDHSTGQILETETVYEPGAQSQSPAGGNGKSAVDRLNEAAGHKAPETVIEQPQAQELPQEQKPPPSTDSAPKATGRVSTADRVAAYMKETGQHDKLYNPETGDDGCWYGQSPNAAPENDLCPKCHAPRGMKHGKPCIGGAVKPDEPKGELERARARWFALCAENGLPATGSPEADDYNRKLLSTLITTHFREKDKNAADIRVTTRTKLPAEWFDIASDFIPKYLKHLTKLGKTPGEEFEK